MGQGNFSYKKNRRANTMSYSTNQLEQIFSEKPFLTAKHKAYGNYSYVEACEQIKQVYENELHYVLIGENIDILWKEWTYID